MTSAGARAVTVFSSHVVDLDDHLLWSTVWAPGIFQFSSNPSQRLFGQCFHIAAIACLEELSQCRSKQLCSPSIRIGFQPVPIAVSNAE